MKISISNLAWNSAIDKQVMHILHKHGVLGIDVAPTKVWQDLLSISNADILEYRNFWAAQGINIIAIQSLLFGHSEMEIFGSSENRNKTLDYLDKVSHLSSQLGAQALIFGSPKNRRIGKLKRDRVENIAKDFFTQMSDICYRDNLLFCLEPNPIQYGCDFITTHQEAIDMAKLVNHPAFKINLDVSTMALNSENYSYTVTAALPWAGYIHISEPFLAPVGEDETTDQTTIAAVLKAHNYDGWLSIEMNEQTENPLSVIEKAINYVKKIYV